MTYCTECRYAKDVNRFEMCKDCFNKRRYKLHSKIRDFTTLNAHTKTIFITESLIKDLDSWQTNNLMELKKYGYNLQYIIK